MKGSGRPGENLDLILRTGEGHGRIGLVQEAWLQLREWITGGSARIRTAICAKDGGLGQGSGGGTGRSWWLLMGASRKEEVER